MPCGVRPMKQAAQIGARRSEPAARRGPRRSPPDTPFVGGFPSTRFSGYNRAAHLLALRKACCAFPGDLADPKCLRRASSVTLRDATRESRSARIIYQVVQGALLLARRAVIGMKPRFALYAST